MVTRITLINADHADFSLMVVCPLMLTLLKIVIGIVIVIDGYADDADERGSRGYFDKLSTSFHPFGCAAAHDISSENP